MCRVLRHHFEHVAELSFFFVVPIRIGISAALDDAEIVQDRASGHEVSIAPAYRPPASMMGPEATPEQRQDLPLGCFVAWESSAVKDRCATHKGLRP